MERLERSRRQVCSDFSLPDNDPISVHLLPLELGGNIHAR